MGYKIIPITVNASGDGSARVTIPGSPLLYGVQYIKNNYADGVDMTLTTSNSVIASTILTITNMNAAASYYTRVDSCGATGSALSANDVYPPLLGSVTITIAQGGNATSGTFVLWYID
jgi:hypothetical protein